MSSHDTWQNLRLLAVPQWEVAWAAASAYLEQQGLVQSRAQ